MDAVEFLKQRTRMCEYYRKAGDCVTCPAENLYFCLGTKKIGGNNATLLVEKVEKWAKEHPVKTRQSEFLKMFPNARIESDGMPSICPIVVDKRCHNKDDEALFCLVRDEEECRKCRRDFWLAEISEGKACE